MRQTNCNWALSVTINDSAVFDIIQFTMSLAEIREITATFRQCDYYADARYLCGS